MDEKTNRKPRRRPRRKKPPLADDDQALGFIDYFSYVSGLPTQTCYGLVKAKKVPFLRLGNRIAFVKSELREFLRKEFLGIGEGLLKEPFAVPIHRKKVRKARKSNTATTRSTQPNQAAAGIQ